MRIGVFGAGAIGASLGIQASAGGLGVRMVGRPALAEAASELVAYDRGGRPHRPSADFVVSTDPAVLRDVDLCLVTVKSRDTEDAARTLAEVLPAATVVVSFQNGLRNPDRLRRHFEGPVVGGVVGYNVVRSEPAVFRQATKGPLVVGALPGDGADRLRALGRALGPAGHRFEIVSDIVGVAAGKLLLNLNNTVCAVTGVTIAESLRSRVLRRCFAALMAEGAQVMRAAGLRPRAVVGLPPALIARLLGLPDAIVLRVARSLADVDPRAKSSTLQDLEAGKPTEVDDLSGEIVRLAAEAGTRAPLNAWMVQTLHALEQAVLPEAFLTPAALHEAFSSVR